MRHPQLVVCETGTGLAAALRPVARQRRWLLRARHQPASCLRLLGRGNPTVLVLRLGACLIDKSLERECRLLERVALHFPDTAVIVVGDGDISVLAALAWDLGAAHVISAAQAREQLPDVATGLMKAAIARAAG